MNIFRIFKNNYSGKITIIKIVRVCAGGGNCPPLEHCGSATANSNINASKLN